MPICPERIARDLQAIARATETPGQGAGRPTFSPAWAQAVDYVVAEAQACGCKARTDAAGNIHIRSADHDAGVPLWLCGSHLDSVPHGGDFDGVVGVVVPLELLRAAARRRTPGLSLGTHHLRRGGRDDIWAGHAGQP